MYSVHFNIKTQLEPLLEQMDIVAKLDELALYFQYVVMRMWGSVEKIVSIMFMLSCCFL